MVLLWAVGVVGGFALLVGYSATAGIGDSGSDRWPDNARIGRFPDRPTLLVFLHPACPCSRATVQELSRLLATISGQVNAVAVFIRPSGFEEGWERTQLWESAARIPHVRAIADPFGEEARRFAAATSGCTMVFDRQGRLIFRGGITPARGHEGDSSGKAAIRSWFAGGPAEPSETPVFGCPLFDETTPPAETLD